MSSLRFISMQSLHHSHDRGSVVHALVYFPVTVKEEDLARVKEETLISHRQLRLLVAELELTRPTMPCLRIPCIACKYGWLQRRTVHLTRSRTQSTVVMVGTESTQSSTSGKVAARRQPVDCDSTDELFSLDIEKSSTRATSYWAGPRAKPSNMGIEMLASTLERLADLSPACGGKIGVETTHSATAGSRRSSSASIATSVSDLADMAEEAKSNPEVFVDSYTVALRLARAGAPSHWAKQLARIFGTRRHQYGAADIGGRRIRDGRRRVRSGSEKAWRRSSSHCNDATTHAPSSQTLPQEQIQTHVRTLAGMTIAEVVSHATVQLGIDARHERSDQRTAPAGPPGTVTGLSLAATLKRCMDELGLSDPKLAAANGDSLTSGGSDEGGGGVTMRQRAAAVAAELEIATGWD